MTQSDYGDTNESGYASALIEEAKTDSESEAEAKDNHAQIEEANIEQLLQMPIETETKNHSRRIKSLELLKPPTSDKRTSRFKREERKKSIRFDSVALWLDSSAEGDLDEMNRLFTNEKLDVNLCNEKGVTAIHRASALGQLEVLKFLVINHANVNALDCDGWTPLHNAASAGSLEAVRLLLQHGANVEAKTDVGDTASDLTEIPEILDLIMATSKTKYSSNKVRALYDFHPDEASGLTGDELAFDEGSVLTVLSREDPDWWLAELDEQKGYVPKNLVQ